MLITLKSFKSVGIQTVPVKVECEITSGIGIHLVGLADRAVKESLLRTITAMQANGYRIPGKKIIINLAPADLYKSGCGYDLPIALAIIAALEQKSFTDSDKYVIAGELALDGTVRPVTGAVQAAKYAEENGLSIILPRENAFEAKPFFDSRKIYGVSTLDEAIDIMEGKPYPTIYEEKESRGSQKPEKSAWSQIQGNEGAKRAIEIAAAGGHNILLVGNPGSQKGTIAMALKELLPDMYYDETLETASVYSAAGLSAARKNNETVRPFRAPHYAASLSSLLGGGESDSVRPGEVSFAHNGVLYLDEFNMFPKSVIEALRGPLEDGKVMISRQRSITEYPSRFLLVAAINPCPCGYYGTERCNCTPAQREAFLSRIYTPVYDRIDIHAYTQAVNTKNNPVPENEDIREVRKRVWAARAVQFKRFGIPGKTNADMTAADIEKYVTINDDVKDLLEKLMDRLGLSARTYTRMLKVSRTIADLAGSETISTAHVAEAAGYRFLDRISD